MQRIKKLRQTFSCFFERRVGKVPEKQEKEQSPEKPERFEVKKVFMGENKDKSAFTPIFVLEDGREVQAVWNPTGSCWVTTFEEKNKEDQ